MYYLKRLHEQLKVLANLVRLNLSYPIENFDLSKEVAFVSMLSDNIRYEFMELWTIELELRNKQVMAGTYTRRKLINLIKGNIELTQVDNNP